MGKDCALLLFLLSLCFNTNGQRQVCNQENEADIVFLVDGSSSIGWENFQQIRNFLSTVINNFEIGPNKVRIGLVQYSTSPRTEFFLNTYESKGDILNYIRDLRYQTGGTRTGQGLEFILKNHFVESAGSRAHHHVPQIAVVITDGDSQDDVAVWAKVLRQREIEIFAIGIKEADEKMLEEIASEPFDQHVYSVTDFAALQKITQRVTGYLCTAVSDSLEVTKNCNETAEADVVLLVDSSDNIGNTDFEEIKNFLHAAVDRFNLKPEKVRLGLTLFSDRPHQEILLGEYSDKRDLHRKMDQLVYRGGVSRMGQGLRFIQEKFFDNARKNVPWIAFVITNGYSVDSVEASAQRLRNLGVSIFVIKVGESNMEKLRAIANIPHEEFLFSIDNYQELQNLKSSIQNKVCLTVKSDFKHQFADFFILVDASANNKELGLIKSFLLQLVRQLRVGKDFNHIGIAQFSEDVEELFPLNNGKSKAEMETAIQNLQLRSQGRRRIGYAIDYVHTRYLKESTEDLKQFLLVIAAGESADGVVQPARRIKKDAVTVFAAGLKRADATDMKLIASQSHNYTLFGNVGNVMKKIKSSIEDEEEFTVTEECRTDLAADIAFIVDQSTSIQSGNFQLIRDFLENTISGLQMDEKKIQVAIILYSDFPQADVYFNTFKNKSQILRYIRSMRYGRGGTKTGAALKFAREKVFIKERGSRKDEFVQQVAVVITDGKSADDVAKEAADLRRFGVTVFAVGIKDTDENDLKEIASYPPEKFVKGVRDFLELDSLAGDLTKMLCNEISDSNLESFHFDNVVQGCKQTVKADIYFLLDESGSILYRDFEDMKKFVQECLDVFQIGKDHVRIGVVKFATYAKTVFRVHDFSTKFEVQRAVKKLQMYGGGTRTDRGLREMIPLFKEAVQTRGEKARQLLIVITDGESTGTVEPVQVPANLLRVDQDVSIYSIGVKNASKAELELISGDRQRTFYVQNYDALKDIKKEILTEICSFEGCEGLFADVVFLIDGSESSTPEDFIKSKEILTFLVKKFAIGPEKERVTVLQYDTNTYEEFILETRVDEKMIEQKINNIKQRMGKTFTGAALNESLNYFKESRGGRSNALKFLIHVTNGESRDDVASPAQSLRDNSINIFSIGLTHANRNEILAIAGSHGGVFYEDTVASLNDLSSEVLFKICNTECKTPELIDIIFLVDVAGRPGNLGFEEMKNLMQHVVKKSVVSPNRVQFGIVTFSDTIDEKLHLIKQSSQAEVQRVISDLKCSGGIRNTAKALNSTLRFFAELYGGRIQKNVPQVLFLITDGKVDDFSELGTWSEMLQESQVNFFAIGVGDADSNQLATIAGDKRRMQYVKTYEELQGLRSPITQELCNLTKPICEMPAADLVFLIDGSETISDQNWVAVKDIMIGIVKQLDVAQDKWRVAVAQFSDIFLHEFYLNSYTKFSEVKTAIENMNQRKQGTHTWEALRLIKYYFTKENGSRIEENIAQNLLLITDGEARDTKDLKALEFFRQKNIAITIIGIGRTISVSELSEIAGSTDRVLIATFEGIKQNLKITIKKVLNFLCQDPQKDSPGCSVDIAFGFDVSSPKPSRALLGPHTNESVAAAIHQLSIISDLCCVKAENISMKFAYRLVSGQDGRTLDEYEFHNYEEAKLKKVLAWQPNELLAFNKGLLDSFRNLFIQNSNASAKILVIFSDGLDDSLDRLIESSENLKNSGVHALLIVSLSGKMNVTQLEFGRGYGYIPLLRADTTLSSALVKQIETVLLRECCNVTCSCIGPPGPRGPSGYVGEKGWPGQDGHPGFPGDEGAMGERGPPGQNGTEGHNGCRGNRGLKGSRGYTGSKGGHGEDGLDGVDGEQGVKGFKGTTGPKGDKGVRGDPGLPGRDNFNPGPKGERGDDGLPVAILSKKRVIQEIMVFLVEVVKMGNLVVLEEKALLEHRVNLLMKKENPVKKGSRVTLDKWDDQATVEPLEKLGSQGYQES
ncbi:hypothetical protein DNTS_026991 [Danionella cerebrum]|uniref:VWFA domain-containing protein n=1 Tax=Danionella cerebrum TaxID=2873325 RepID=A0A553N574_9TELE|nr:hypothetical protein DNTS_026991 [Danionella translucida]TRY60583.1 hypothetical protein DNTS_026991 [Danionella translucida]